MKKNNVLSNVLNILGAIQVLVSLIILVWGINGEVDGWWIIEIALVVGMTLSFATAKFVKLCEDYMQRENGGLCVSTEPKEPEKKLTEEEEIENKKNNKLLWCIIGIPIAVFVVIIMVMCIGK